MNPKQAIYVWKCFVVCSVVCLCGVYVTQVSAASMRRPWGSLYFRNDVKKNIQYRDALFHTLDTHINTLSQWSYSKNMALRAFVYQYSRQKAETILTNTMWSNLSEEYNAHVFLQTKLYQELQELVTYASTVLKDDTVTLNIVLHDLQSDDPDIFYFYDTLPQRYIDLQRQQVRDKITEGLRKFFTANNRYPYTLEELIDARFVKNISQSQLKYMYYTPHNYPYIAEMFPSSVFVQAYDLKQSWYILATPMVHRPHAQVFSRDEKSMMVMIRTLDYDMWERKLQINAWGSNDAIVGWQVAVER